jgi:hypothetical protein
MKYGHCGGFSRIDILDCVHFCAFSPTMWFPIWFHLLQIAKSNTEQNSTLNRPGNVLYAKYSTDSKEFYVLQHGLLRKVENEACLLDVGLDPNTVMGITKLMMERIVVSPPDHINKLKTKYLGC